jgi:hypothetical protein
MAFLFLTSLSVASTFLDNDNPVIVDTSLCPIEGHVPYGTYTSYSECDPNDPLVKKRKVMCVGIPPKCYKYTCKRCVDPMQIDPSTQRAYSDLIPEAERRANAGKEFVTFENISKQLSLKTF